VIAQLPMYDWPEARAANDALWQSVRQASTARHLDSPAALDRMTDPEVAWRSPELLWSQTCGLPLVTSLAGQVQVIGGFSYRDCMSPGLYHSVIVAREDSPSEFQDFEGHRAVINGLDSYSGCLALKCMMKNLGVSQHFFGMLSISGGHRDSVKHVAQNKADIAAIDCVSWSLVQRFDEEARKLKVVAHTASRPNLPIIASLERTEDEIKLLREATSEAVESLDKNAREITGITGFVSRTTSDYGSIRSDFEKASDFQLAKNERTLSLA